MAVSGKWIDGVGPETPVEQAARRSLEPRLAAVARCLPLAAHLAEHDVEHVHRLRVATRRACAALKLYRELLPSKEARWLKRRLRKVRKAAGDARDLDVLSSCVLEEIGEKATPILELIKRERADVQHAINRVTAKCSHDDRYVRKTAKLIGRIRSPHSENGAPDASTTFGKWAQTQLALIGTSFFEALPDESSNLESLHQFRIRVKALRYAIELVAPVFPAELRDSAYPLVESIQERLGEVQDLVTAVDQFKAWAGDDAHSSLRLLLMEVVELFSEQLKSCVREFHTWWNEEKVNTLRQILPHSSKQHCNGQDDAATNGALHQADRQTQPVP